MNMVGKRPLSVVMLVIALMSQYSRASQTENQIWLHEEHDLNPGQTRTILGSWQQLVNTPPFGLQDGVGTPLLLTDGSVMIQNINRPLTHLNGQIWKLVPDNFGNYVNGTWHQLASLPAGYAPLFFASAVLPDGRAIYEGGEYNVNVSSGAVWTNKGAIFDPTAGPLGTWTSVNPPPFFTNEFGSTPALPIGDAASTILDNGTFMLADSLSNQAALLNP